MSDDTLASERWRRIEELFHAAQGLAVDDVAGFLDRECASDPTLRGEVASLLEAAGAAPGRLRAIVGRQTDRLVDAADLADRKVGAYRLVEEIGEGGMGTVYLAVRDDEEYRTQVAVKLLHHGLETARAVARFRDERQILATLQHPGIVRLLDGGSTRDGVPYLVMERIEGDPITRYADGHGLSVRARVELFRRVCDAVQHAHQKLVVHRDLKPSNILVDAAGAPKLLDFGIAKLLDPEPGEPREAQTKTGALLLTPEYASPEQVRGEPVSTATDVYSLGAVLYELLTGQPPHRAPAGGELGALRAVLEVDPARPSAVAPPARRRALTGDLDNVVLKALHKEPARRYATVEQLSEDLRRHLDGLPVAARAPTWAYRTRKFIRRNRAPLIAALIVVSALCGATAISLAAARRAQRRLDDVRRLAHSLLFEVDDQVQNLEGATAARVTIVRRALEYLDRLAQEAGDDVPLLHELAAGYVKIGDVQGSPRVPNLGRPRDALGSYRKAETMLRRLVSTGRDTTATRWQLARTLFRIGDLQVYGDPELARASLLEATRIAEPLTGAAEFEPKVMVMGYMSLHEAAQDPAAARMYARKCLDVATDWAQHDPSAEPRYWIAVARDMVAHALVMAADPETALGELEAAHAGFEALTSEHPEDARFRREVAFNDHLTALVLSGSEWTPSVPDLVGAEERWRAALGVQERQAQRDPNDSRTAVLMADLDSRLAVLIVARVPEEARAFSARARAIFESLPPATRASDFGRGFEASARCRIAPVLARLGRREEARDQLRTALTLFGDPPDFAGRVELSECDVHAAEAWRTIGDPARAERHLRAATARLRDAIPAQAGAIRPYIGLVEALSALAQVRSGERCALAEEAAALWRSWPGAPTPYTRRRQAELEAQSRQVLGACPLGH